jgi:uncharacterized protein YjbI with pentapeptide repeats
VKKLRAEWWRFKRGWREWWTLARILAMLFVVLGIVGEVCGVYQDISANFIATGITVLVIDTANEIRIHRQFKKDLIHRMGSRVQDEAVRAAEELARHGWLDDGSLVDGLFSHANLQGADLTWADLEKSDFSFANLENSDLQETYLMETNFCYSNLRNANLSSSHAREADFDEADLEGADLTNADLEEANFGNAILRGSQFVKSNLHKTKLYKADLRNANLSDANLREALLAGADLRGANLAGTNIETVNFYDVKLNRATILPNGVKWHANIDMNKFGAVLVPIKVKAERYYMLRLTEDRRKEIEKRRRFIRQLILAILLCLIVFLLRNS